MHQLFPWTAAWAANYTSSTGPSWNDWRITATLCLRSTFSEECAQKSPISSGTKLLGGAISSLYSLLLREILYEKLEDNDVVHEYPHVFGMKENVFFLDHQHKEAGAEDSVSKHNVYEV